MPNISIRGQTVDVDITGELQRFDFGYRARWTTDKLVAASPFRYDSTPSFFVNLDGELAGTWKDSGAYDSEWESGGFVKLLAFLRQETYEETEDYLLAEYGWTGNVETLTIKPPRLRIKQPFRPLDESTVTPAQSRYLEARGIGGRTQALYGVGYGRQRGFTAIPWRTASGQLANVKYRATRGKVFFYEKGAHPIRRLVWGIDVANQLQARTAALCEAEIDGMSWAQATDGEIIGLAAGGVTFTDEQADIIKRSSIERLVLAGDNDKAGRKFNEVVAAKLAGHVELLQADYGEFKDANEQWRQLGEITITNCDENLLINLELRI
ncbi:toprim domain-containing protein [Heyndrickxia sporothermodurans]|uniref:toprim domain-containing protein n=1 Tax=Heyndrickxia sporothermodurans TaxID=46224 RepID=UPI002E1A489F|nr:toprim domain-containing protein [Heyndrickxia sporothermodurans]MED3697980.1 toprim domain-containing protein [Heyndrickxia sporothermodurans]